MEHQQLHIRAQQFIDALHHLEQHTADDVDVMVRLFSDDARLSSAALRLTGNERQGRSGVQQFWTEYRRTFDDVASDFSHVLIGEGAAGLVWTTRGTYAGGDPFAYDGVSLLIFDDAGKIAAFRSFYDTRQLSRAVNATSPATSDRPE